MGMFLFLIQLGDPGDAYIDFRDLIPGGIVYNPGGGQAKDRLDLLHRSLGGGTVDAVYATFGMAG